MICRKTFRRTEESWKSRRQFSRNFPLKCNWKKEKIKSLNHFKIYLMKCLILLDLIASLEKTKERDNAMKEIKD